MKGEIFNMFESFITEGFGADKFDEIFEAIHSQLRTQEPFVGPGTYPDSDFMTLVGKTVEILGIPLEKAAFEFGKYVFPKLAAKVPQYVENHKHPKSFLKTLHDVIHVEVSKLMADAVTPSFEYEDSGDEKELVMIYQSQRKLYDFAEGLIQGVSDYYKVPISVTKRLISDEEGICRFELKFG